MNLMINFLSILCFLILMGIGIYQSQSNRKHIADLEDDIVKLKSNRQIPIVVDGYIVYVTEYENKHRND